MKPSAWAGRWTYQAASALELGAAPKLRLDERTLVLPEAQRLRTGGGGWGGDFAGQRKGQTPESPKVLNPTQGVEAGF